VWARGGAVAEDDEAMGEVRTAGCERARIPVLGAHSSGEGVREVDCHADGYGVIVLRSGS
jgi:hypothetical protein